MLMQIGTAGPQLSGTIATVEPDVLSPEQARQQYALNGNLALVVTEPSTAVTVTLGPDIRYHVETSGRSRRRRYHVETSELLPCWCAGGAIFFSPVAGRSFSHALTVLVMP